MLDMGICPEYLPGYRTYEHAAAACGTAWKSTVSATAGKNLFQIFDAIESGQIKALYVMGSDPLHFMPDRNRVLKALKKLDLLVVQELFPTATAAIAHVVFPAATGAEKSGSFTSVDNRVQCFSAAVKPACGARSDADILTNLHRLVVPTAAVLSPEALHHEISTVSGLYSEFCDHNGCRMGRAKNRIETGLCVPLSPAVPAQKSHPFTLTIGPLLHHNGSMTTWSKNNRLVAGEPYVELSIENAATLGVAAGDILKISTDCASISIKARPSASQQPGNLFVPSHFRNLQLNLLYGSTTLPLHVSLTKG
jgi:formate dehydrogenase alpha subunit